MQPGADDPLKVPQSSQWLLEKYMDLNNHVGRGAYRLRHNHWQYEKAYALARSTQPYVSRWKMRVSSSDAAQAYSR